MTKNKKTYEDLILLSKETDLKLKAKEINLEEATITFLSIIESIHALKNQETKNANYFSNLLKDIVRPITECEISLSKQRMALHEMFSMAVSNIPENESDNFTVRKLTPAYLGFCQLLENVQELE
jgi:hypothetical protein